MGQNVNRPTGASVNLFNQRHTVETDLAALFFVGVNDGFGILAQLINRL
ncbi:MAG: hypothetical protein WBG38_19200 [Nodosilinea sp.]